MALGDLNGDLNLDLYVANYKDSDGGETGDWVFLNDGDGSLRSGAGMINTGQSLGNYRSRSVELGDIDRDGDLDAIVATEQPAGHRIWINDGFGVFEESQQSLAPGGEHVALADLNGDGHLDLFAASIGGNLIWINNGQGVFSDSGQRLGAAKSSYVTLGDLDLDGDIDAFVANGLGDANTIWLNNGSGVFSDSGARLAPNVDTQRATLGDIDGDGDLDVITTSSGTANHTYLNQTRIADIVRPQIASTNVIVTRGVIETVEVVFSEPVNLPLNSLNFGGQTLTDSSQFSWSDDGMTARWDIRNAELGAGNYLLTVFSAIVSDAAGNRLFGNTASSAFQEPIFVPQPGDADGDFDVDFADFLILSRNFGNQNASSGDGDLDGDGKVSFADFLRAFSKLRATPLDQRSTKLVVEDVSCSLRLV